MREVKRVERWDRREWAKGERRNAGLCSRFRSRSSKLGPRKPDHDDDSIATQEEDE